MPSAADLLGMAGEPANAAFCNLAAMREDEDGEELALTNFNAGWCGPVRDHSIPGSVARKVAAFLQARPAVLHIDELINKKEPVQVRYLLQQVLKQRTPIQVAFLQGVIPLQSDDLFPRLLDFLLRCPVWSVNLGELRFSEEQCVKLAAALREGGVTHMFYECTVAGSWKETFRTTIRDNRAKHGFYRLGPDAEQNRVVLAAIKSWYVPTSHVVNKRWAMQKKRGWTGVERVQCAACGKWRRLPPGVRLSDEQASLKWRCEQNKWDPSRQSCAAAEEPWN